MEQQTLTSDIASDTINGLSSNPKYLLSKYFYDDAGSSIFQDIMKMPEYYLTDCEFEIFSTYKKQIITAFRENVAGFDLIELGSGDGMKTKILLQYLTENSVRFHYIPIDISQKANSDLVKCLKSEFPLLNVTAKTGDYFQELKNLNGYSGLRKIILFLGSNIGNFSDTEINLFFEQLSNLCHKGDKALIGFDKKKSPNVILNAYSDQHGHTCRFNLNHLNRLNKELNANFNIENFEHYSEYNPLTGAVKSFLVSKNDQTVCFSNLGQSFHFKKWEPIFMELSRKFDDDSIETLAKDHGFKIEKQFTDKLNYYVDSLLVKE